MARRRVSDTALFVMASVVGGRREGRGEWEGRQEDRKCGEKGEGKGEGKGEMTRWRKKMGRTDCGDRRR